ncbi:MAG: response regulator [Bacteroidota bacterium]|nr:response regulator [Bacteroidota bacterium]
MRSWNTNILSKGLFICLAGFFILLNNQKVFAQQESEQDSLESLLPYANDLQRADILNGIANCIRTFDTTKAGNYARQAYILSGKLNYCKGKATADIILGILQKNRGNYLSAQEHYLSGLALALKCKEPYSVSFAYHSLGNLAYLKGNKSRAMRYYIGSVKISEQIKDNSRAARTYTNIGTLYLELEDMEKAEEYYLRALDLFKGNKEELVVAEIENNLANIYKLKGYDLKALYHYSNALEVFRKLSSASDISSALNNIGLVYLDRNQVRKALPFFIESLKLDISIKDEKAIAFTSGNLAVTYFKLNKMDSALYFAQGALKYAIDGETESDKANAYGIMADIYGKKGDKAKYKHYLDLKNQTENSTVSKDEINEITNLTIRHENERKEARLRLMAKENEINRLKIHEQQMELETKNLLLIVFSVTIFLLLLITGLVVYGFYLNKQKKLFEMSSKAKSSMLQQINHEIRTPLHGIVGMSQLALESKTFVELKDYLANIKLSSDELMFVLNNLIAYLQIDRKEAHPVSIPFDLVELLEELFRSYDFQCKAKGLLFNQMVYPGLPRMVKGDSQKMNTIVQNLLSNAVKHSSKGIVKVEVKQTANRIKDRKQLSTIQFSVSDEGPGMDEKEIKHVFRGNVKVSDKGNGFGIGLKNVKELCDLLKGHIEVISEKGVGSTFIVELELEVLAQNSLKQSDVPLKLARIQPNKYSILVAEDNQLNQRLLTKILEKVGYNYGIASNGNKALELLKEKSFDLILMDIRMPEMDGIETAYNIRNKEEFILDRDIPIIAVTAHDDAEEKKKCYDIGMNDYVTKPFNKDILLQKIGMQLLSKAAIA